MKTTIELIRAQRSDGPIYTAQVRVEDESHNIAFMGRTFNPTGPGDTPTRRRIFTCRPTSSADEARCGTQILSTLARRAYRRPVTEEDLQPLLTFFNQGRAGTGNFEAGWAGRGFTRPGPECDVGYQAGYAPADAEARAGMVTICDGSATSLTGPRRAPSVPGRQTGADGRTFHDRQHQ